MSLASMEKESEMTEAGGEVVRIDRDAEDRDWAEERMDAFGNIQQSAWSVALDLAANWFDGRNVSRLYPDPRYPEEPQPMTLAMALRDHWASSPMKAITLNYANQLVNTAQVYLMAGEGYEAVAPFALRPFGPPEKWTPEMVRATLREVEERFGREKLDYNHVRAVIHPTKMNPPYWQQVIDNLTTGAHLLTPADARNVIATAVWWLGEQPRCPDPREQDGVLPWPEERGRLWYESGDPTDPPWETLTAAERAAWIAEANASSEELWVQWRLDVQH